jgi:hypothetical protein
VRKTLLQSSMVQLEESVDELTEQLDTWEAHMWADRDLVPSPRGSHVGLLRGRGADPARRRRQLGAAIKRVDGEEGKRGLGQGVLQTDIGALDKVGPVHSTFREGRFPSLYGRL